MIPIDNVLRWIFLLVPEDTNSIATEHYKLISRIGITKPRLEVLFVLELFDFGRLIFIINTAFPAVAVNIGQLVDGNCVFLVQRRAMKLFCCSRGLLWSVIFNKSKPGSISIACYSTGMTSVPFRHVFVVHRHKDGILSCLAHSIEFPEQEFDELWLLFCINDR